MKNFYASLKGICFLMLMMCWGVGFGQPGTLDASFGNSGIATVAFDSTVYSYSSAIQTDGKLVLAGLTASASNAYYEFAVTRFNSNGSIDNAFGNFGKVVFNLGAYGTIRISTCRLATQSDGKIVIGGTFQPNTSALSKQFFLLRLKANGTFDSTFGTNGVVYTDLGGGNSSLESILVTPLNKIISSGYRLDTTRHLMQFALVQYNPNGLLDSSFGINGLANVVTNEAYGFTMALTDQSKIIIAGRIQELLPTNRLNFAMVRVLSNGITDSTFGINGVAETDFADYSVDEARSIAIQTDGKIILGGRAYVGANYAGQFRMVRYDSNGTIDFSFGLNGKVFDSVKGFFNQLHVLSNGHILVTGNSKTGGDFRMVDYNSDGTVDSSFGTNGIVSTFLTGSDGGSCDSQIQIDGKIVMAGGTTINSKGIFVAARYKLTTLPLHLLTFTAKRANNANLLSWTTAQEINTDRFEIERSTNGREFSKIGFVTAGNTRYTFTDNNPLKAANYYRLKMMDKDGKFEYSLVRQLTINHSFFAISIFPNPAHNKLQLQINSDQKTTLQLDIITQDGKVVLSNNLSAAEGSMLRSINIAALQSGTYFLRATSGGGEQSVVKFEKVQ